MLPQQCKRDYRRYSKSKLHTFCNEVENGIYNNSTVFVTPPLSTVDYEARKETFFTTQADYKTYGITKKVAYLEARKVIFTTLDSLSSYVDGVALGNGSTIALSGFKPTIAEPQKNGKLEKIGFFSIKHTNVSGELLIEIPAIANQVMVFYTCLCIKSVDEPTISLYNGQLKFNPEVISVILDSNKNRKKKFVGLQPGAHYFFYVYAANTVSVSPISNAQSIWAS